MASEKKTGRPMLPADERARVHEHVLRLFNGDCGGNATELGRKLGISRVAARALVNGGGASISTIQALASALNTTEQEIRVGSAAAHKGAEWAMEVALSYWPGRWTESTVSRGWEVLRAGERHSPQGWAAALDKLGEDGGGKGPAE